MLALQVCTELGVAAVVMPEISDILQGRKTSAVCSTLAYLASACVQAGIEVISISPLLNPLLSAGSSEACVATPETQNLCISCFHCKMMCAALTWGLVKHLVRFSPECDSLECNLE